MFQGFSRLRKDSTKSTSYAYNLDGSIKSATYPSGRSLNYSYSPPGSSLSAGRPVSVIDSTGPINYVTAATYAPFGGLTGMYNGIVAGGFTGSYGDGLITKFNS
jgi:hypothetical protein